MSRCPTRWRLKCDRCGFTYDFDPGEDGADEWLELSVGNPKLGRLRDERDLDLCPSCLTDFETWLNAKKLAAPAKVKVVMHEPEP